MKKESLYIFSKCDIELISMSNQESQEYVILCKTLWYTGVRLKELLEMTAESVDIRNGSIRIQNARVRKRQLAGYRNIPVEHEFINELKKYIEEKQFGIKERLFNYTERTALNYLKRACKKAGFNAENANASTFRYSYAVYWIQHGVKIMQLNEWLGNRDVKKTVQLYVDRNCTDLKVS